MGLIIKLLPILLTTPVKKKQYMMINITFHNNSLEKQLAILSCILKVFLRFPTDVQPMTGIEGFKYQA